MYKIQLEGLILNFIIYIIMLIPIFLILFNKKIYKNKIIFLKYFIFSIIIELLLSLILYKSSYKIFSFFTNTTGLINYAVYASKILFITSSLYSIKFLIPAYLFVSYKKNNIITSHKNFLISRKKTAILFLSKIAVNIIFIFIGYTFFSNKGILFSIPFCDTIYYIIYIILIIFN